MVETVFACLILVIFFLACADVFNMVRTSLYVHKIAREGCREASMTASIGAGEAKAKDCARQYFGSSKTTIRATKNSDAGKDVNVVFNVSHPIKSFTFLPGGGKVVNLDAQAVYPWWDENP